MPNDYLIAYNKYHKYIDFLKDESVTIINSLNSHFWYRYIPTNVKSYSDDYLNKFLKGRMVNLPIFNFYDIQGYEILSNFEEFTSTKELTNIALWTLSALIYNSKNKSDIRYGKEIEILHEANPRNGRLDVVIKSNKSILIIETKVTLRKLLDENRFTIQMKNYSEEIQRQKSIFPQNPLLVLEIGGYESDLYPLNHPDCLTNNVGNITSDFYNKILSNNIKFISANALWCLVEKSLYWEDTLFQWLSDPKVFGILTGGLVIYKNNEFIIDPVF